MDKVSQCQRCYRPAIYNEGQRAWFCNSCWLRVPEGLKEEIKAVLDENQIHSAKRDLLIWLEYRSRGECSEVLEEKLASHVLTLLEHVKHVEEAIERLAYKAGEHSAY